MCNTPPIVKGSVTQFKLIQGTDVFHVFSFFAFHNIIIHHMQVNINENYKSHMFCMNSRFTLGPASCKKNGHVVPSTLLFFHGGSSTSDISWSPSEVMSVVSEEHHFKRGRRKCLTPSNNSLNLKPSS